jgi:uncharacterized membrane protein YdbT with pleckstrin-like domain
MDTLQGETVVWKGHPSWKALLLYYVKWTLVSLVPAALWVLLDSVMSDPPSPSLFALVTVCGLVLTYGVGWIRRATTRYTITSSRIHIRTGIVSRREHSTQLSRIQNVNVNQSLFQRILGIGNVDWDTAGTEESGADFTLRGVDDPSGIVRVVDERLHAGAATIEQ